MQIRKLLQPHELDAASRFEGEIWGVSDPTPRVLLLVFAHHGGLVLGAYHDGNLVGISLGFPGLDEDGRTYLHSHLLAVSPEFRGRRVGESLKRAQWDYARTNRLPYIGWTYDPLVQGNAWLNLGVLAGRVDALRDNVYGSLNDNFNGALPTHRFWVTWSTQDSTSDAPSGVEYRMMPIPQNVGELRQKNPSAAREQFDQ